MKRPHAELKVNWTLLSPVNFSYPPVTYNPPYVKRAGQSKDTTRSLYFDWPAHYIGVVGDRGVRKS